MSGKFAYRSALILTVSIPIILGGTVVWRLYENQQAEKQFQAKVEAVHLKMAVRLAQAEIDQRATQIH